MKKVILIIATILFTFNVFSQDRGFGIGIIVGEPTGLSLKSWTGSKTAIDAAAAWSFAGEGALHLHADVLVHNFKIFNPNKGRLPVYIGLGGKVVLESDLLLGARIPIGINYLFSGAPFDFFAEIVPTMNLLPSTDFDIGGGIGLRVWF